MRNRKCRSLLLLDSWPVWVLLAVLFVGCASSSSPDRQPPVAPANDYNRYIWLSSPSYGCSDATHHTMSDGRVVDFRPNALLAVLPGCQPRPNSSMQILLVDCTNTEAGTVLVYAETVATCERFLDEYRRNQR